MNNKIPESRIELQKLKIEVLRKYFVITIIVTILNFFAVLLYGNQLIQSIVLGICIYLLYKSAKIFNILVKKETEATYKMIEESRGSNE